MEKIRLKIFKWAISGISPKDKHMDYKVCAGEGTMARWGEAGVAVEQGR